MGRREGGGATHSEGDAALHGPRVPHANGLVVGARGQHVGVLRVVPQVEYGLLHSATGRSERGRARNGRTWRHEGRNARGARGCSPTRFGGERGRTRPPRRPQMQRGTWCCVRPSARGGHVGASRYHPRSAGDRMHPHLSGITVKWAMPGRRTRTSSSGCGCDTFHRLSTPLRELAVTKLPGAQPVQHTAFTPAPCRYKPT